ncbi:MAG: hypothetical protein DMG97_25975 [Acidobacteria bacterium]|nr:MAG: hypothetical protein DMG98_02425 [Acidobacteriota bacterium]PYV67995.1 MAG: hypothetical protein DMG97_25975 [Acidobacteriota bacterium]PYV80191.1 MAG: hypothetical protein DMG96_01520 [Acidobacteriota bacterium]
MKNDVSRWYCPRNARSALIINGTPDHVHVLARIRPVHSPAEIARVIKTNSSRWIHQKWRIKFGWQLDTGCSA